ncbi:MAG: MFS transporter [Vibrio sp.]
MTTKAIDQFEQGSMSQVQIIAVIICIALNALDGFDVLAISFAAPGISQEWQIDRGALGIVLATELIGMAAGSILLGGWADKYGRKPIIQMCLILMALGMLMAAYTQSVNSLLVCRFITGIGIGGMLAATNAMVSEFSNIKNRHLCVIIMATGYPLGAIVGGTIASELLEYYSWRSVFIFGGLVTLSFIFIVAFFLPESIHFLLRKQPKNALVKINDTLLSMNKATLNLLPDVKDSKIKVSYSALFSPNFKMITILLMVAYFAQVMTFYYILKWIPKIVVDMGFHPSQAGQVLVWANVGGAMGALLLGTLSRKINLKPLLISMLVVAFIMVYVFGQGYSNLAQLAMISAVTGFFTNSGIVGLFALMAQYFPPEIRASGTGVVIGVGRGGAALSPIIAGYLFSSGISLQTVSLLMGAGALLAASAIFLLKPATK